MELPQSRLERRHAIAGRLDDDLTFRFPLELALPSIDRHHRRVYRGTGGEPLLDELARQLLGALVGGGRGQDEDDISHSSTIARMRLVTPSRIVVLSFARGQWQGSY